MARSFRNKPKEQPRKTAAERGYDHRWRKARLVWLIDHPFCVECEKRGIINASQSNHVDHIIPHKGNPVLFWDQSNWQTLCAECHNTKEKSAAKNIHRGDRISANGGCG